MNPLYQPAAKSAYRGANEHEPQRQGGDAIEPESNNDDIDGAMHSAVGDAKDRENPGGNPIAPVDARW